MLVVVLFIVSEVMNDVLGVLEIGKLGICLFDFVELIGN